LKRSSVYSGRARPDPGWPNPCLSSNVSGAPPRRRLALYRSPAKRMLAAKELPSAKKPCRDILFPLLIRGRKPADCGHSWQIVRTMRTGLGAQFGPFFVSLGSLSPKQPNHGHFGTDVESSIIQRVAWHPKGVGFAKAPLRRSEPGSNHLVQCVCFRPQSRPVIRRLRPAARDPKPT
jgi:hypothetical protein